MRSSRGDLVSTQSSTRSKKAAPGRAADDTAADGLVAAAAPTSEKALAPVAQRSGIVHRLEAFIVYKTAAAAAAAATAKPAHEAAARISCS